MTKSTPNILSIMFSVSLASSLVLDVAAAEKSSMCNEIALPELSDYGFITRERTVYPNDELGQSIHYYTASSSKSSPFEVSLYLFDFGSKTITSELEEEVLRMAYSDILNSPSNAHYTFANAFQIPDFVFENLKPELSRGFHLRGISSKPLAHDQQFAAVGQYRNCFLKLRMTIGSGEPGKEDDMLGFKLLNAIASRIKQRLE